MRRSLVSSGLLVGILVVPGCGDPAAGPAAAAPGSALEAVYKASQCDDRVERMPFDSHLQEITEWLRVTGTDESANSFGDLHEWGSATLLARSIKSAADAPEPAERVEVETSEAFADAVAGAASRPDLNVYVALGADPTNPAEGVIRPILGFASDGKNVAFLGWCISGFTDYVEQLFGEDAGSVMTSIVGLTGDAAVATFHSELGGVVDSVPDVVTDLPQYLPGMSEPDDLDADAVSPHTVTVVWAPLAEPESGPRRMCVGSERLLGSCWTDGAGDEADDGQVKIEATSYLADGEDLILYQAESVTEHPLAEIGRIAAAELRAGTRHLVLVDSSSGAYRVVGTERCDSGHAECGPALAWPTVEQPSAPTSTPAAAPRTETLG